jgi:hypothetical protein
MIQQYVNYFKTCFSGEEGIGTLEVVLLIFVLLGFVILFRERMMGILTSYLDSMDPKLTR